MIPGVNFQPGAGSFQDRADAQRDRVGSGHGVQEAIKLLSLRMPKVVGAQSVAPSALLNSPGAGGNPNVDSMVERVLQRVFPTARQGQGAPTAPMVPSPAISSDRGTPGLPMPPTDGTGEFHHASTFPRVIVGLPPNLPMAPFVGGPPRRPGYSGTDADLSAGGGQPPGLIAELPPLPQHFPGAPSTPSSVPSLMPDLDWLPAPAPERYEF